ncbi:MAG TPA: hypothetical protein VMJ12_01015, partial [Candidatus Acidoferrales bacterium]|nr:hypothetical protein [Candidatus Acidoferrales bacterium]
IRFDPAGDANINFSSTHAGGGELEISSQGSAAIAGGYNGLRNSHVQLGSASPNFPGYGEFFLFNFDGTPTNASNPLGFSHWTEWDWRYWSGGQAGAGMRGEATDTNGHGGMSFYTAITNSNPGTNQLPGARRGGFYDDGWVQFGKQVKEYREVAAVGNTNVAIDYSAPQYIAFPLVTTNVNLYETNFQTNCTAVIDARFFNWTTNVNFNVPTNWLLETGIYEDGGIANNFFAYQQITNIPAKTVLKLHIETQTTGSYTNTSVVATLAPWAGPVIDPDAQTFINAAGLTNLTAQNAINSLVLAMKADGTWSKMDCIYPLVGGTSNTCSWNLRNTSKFRIAWTGSMTFNANGITGDASTAFGDTQFNPTTATSPNYALNSASYGFYNKTASPTDNSCLMGIIAANFASVRVLSGNYVQRGPNDANGVQGQPPVVTGLIASTRTSSSTVTIYTPSTSTGSGSSTSSAVPNGDFYLDAEDNGGLFKPSNANLAFAFIGSALSSTDYSNLAADVLAFQTALSRQ